MVFGIFRARSESKKQSSSSRARPHAHTPNRSQSARVRPTTHHDDAAAAYYRAKQIYEAEEEHIMREQLRKRNQNDLECKRHMSMIERNKDIEVKRVQSALAIHDNALLKRYHAGKIDMRQLEKKREKIQESSMRDMRSAIKRYRDEQNKAQRIFFSRGEELGVEAGAALRRAREKMERSQRIPLR